MSILGLEPPPIRRRGPGRPRGSKNRPKAEPALTAALTHLQGLDLTHDPLPSVPLTQVEIDALAEYAVGYPLEEAAPSERAAFARGLAKLQARRSR